MNKVSLTSFLKGEVTKQEVFDHVLTHLRKQGRPSFTHTTCKYRSQDGEKCAIGSLIPDSEYKDRMEHNTVDALCRKFYRKPSSPYIKGKIFILDSPIAFLVEMQTVLHDRLFISGLQTSHADANAYAKGLNLAAKRFARKHELECKDEQG